ncbi:MAG: enoyl-[acyl-carrier-protein] reductase FabV [Actinocatenispora sp.]
MTTDPGPGGRPAADPYGSAPMTGRTVSPRSYGFLYFDSHPVGCARHVRDLWRAVPGPTAATSAGGGPVALVVGSSAGYGLAATIAGLARVGIRGVGVCSEKPTTDRRTATAGWYRTAATAELARRHGRDMVFVNGDAFADTTKEQVAELLRDRFGGRLDYLVHSVAAPRRTDPDTGVGYTSALRPVGSACRTRTLLFDDGCAAEVSEVEVRPAGQDEIDQTIAVMGGADWARWIDHLADRGLLADGFSTVALSYVGSALTAPIYRHGTIGAAKAHLERTARELDGRLGTLVGGRAMISVNGVAVTQSSTVIPGVALYVALLRGVLGEAFVPPVAQLTELWDRITGARPLDVDDEGRVRLDGWELDPAVQAAVADRWAAASNDTIGDLADLDWLRTEVRRLYGFAVPGVDYAAAVRTDVPWPGAEGTGS